MRESDGDGANEEGAPWYPTTWAGPDLKVNGNESDDAKKQNHDGHKKDNEEEGRAML